MMKSRLRMFIVTLLFLFFFMFCYLPAFANEIEDPEDYDSEAAADAAFELFKERNPEATRDDVPDPDIIPADFGQVDWHFTWLGAPDFIQEGLWGRAYAAGGYHWRTGGDQYFSANISLPSGATIGRLSLYFYDGTNLAGDNIYMDLVRYRSDTDTGTNYLGGVSTWAAPGYDTIHFDPFVTFDNYHQYRVLIQIPITNNDIRFKGVRIAYRRNISPAPPYATFWDVPTGHNFHREVEALADSGITGGIGGGAYGPDEYVTRGQMAAFLSRALGLHHNEPYF